MPDFTRLKSVLLSSGLQQQNNALFQVINTLLTLMGNIPGATLADAISGGGGTVGPDGPQGSTGLQGIPGIGFDGHDGEDAAIIPIGFTVISGGGASSVGPQGPIGPPGIDGLDAYFLQELIAVPSIHQLLDLLAGGNVSFGSIIYRDQTLWKALAPGTSSYFLQTLGTGSAPAWAPFTDTPLRTSLQFAMFVSAGGTLVCDGPFSGVGTITGTTNAKPTNAFSDSFYWNAATSATIASAASYIPNTGGTGPINFTWDFDISFVIRTDITAVTGIRYWFIIGAASSPGNVDTLPSNGIAFRFSTGAGDAGWVGVTFDGTQAVTASVASVAANTKYILRIRKVSGTVFFSVNGGTEVSTTSHVPTNDVYVTPVCLVTNVVGGVGSARSLYFSRCFGNIGS